MQLRALAVRGSFCLLVTTLFGGALLGCSIRHNDRFCDADESADEDDCEARPVPDAKTPTPTPPAPTAKPANTVCDSFCDRLVVCGSIRAASVVACRADCQAGLLADPVGTRSGCACVERDACRPLSDYACPGAPLPPGDDGPSGGTGGTSGGGGSHGGTAGASGGTGAACTASCQCDEGEACEAGRCVADAPPPAQCATDCECLKGQSCVAGACQ